MEASEAEVTLSTSVGSAVVDSCWRRVAAEEAGQDARVVMHRVTRAVVRIDGVERAHRRRPIVAAGRLVGRALGIHGARLGAHALAGGDVADAARVALGTIVVAAARIAN